MLSFLVSLGLLAHCSAQHNYVVGGQPAFPGEYPWQGSVRNFEDLHVCGCVLVDSTHALTTAHCQVGSGFITDWGDVENGGENRTSVVVGAVVRHPGWGDGVTSGFSPNDLAVLNLVSAVEGPNIEPIGLSRRRVSEEIGFVAGWGRQCANCSISDTLYFTGLEMISDGRCSAMWDEQYNGDVHVCGWDTEEQQKATCSGDGGSGLTVEGEDGPELHGLVSWGSSDCTPSLPSVFTRLSQYVGWICEETDNQPMGCEESP